VLRATRMRWEGSQGLETAGQPKYKRRSAQARAAGLAGRVIVQAWEGGGRNDRHGGAPASRVATDARGAPVHMCLCIVHAACAYRGWGRGGLGGTGTRIVAPAGDATLLGCLTECCGARCAWRVR
jgi:hypothetical protein